MSASSVFAGRPAWANALLVFTAFMTFVYTPWDIFVKPVETDQEVWFGLLLTGRAAKATAPLHWAIYGAFTWGLWKMRPWMRFWGTVWIVQIAIGMLVWNLTDPRGTVIGGLVSGAVFAWLARAYWRAGVIFERAARATEPAQP
jgi:hypothetical protein